MPRKGKRQTLSGDPALAAAPAVGVPYGEGERRLESQRRTPLPNVRARAEPPADALPAGGGGGPGGADARMAAVQAAIGMAEPTSMLSAPTERPGEPLMAGIESSGDILRPAIVTNEAYYELRALARRFPYPDLMRLLARVESEM